MHLKLRNNGTKFFLLLSLLLPATNLMAMVPSRWVVKGEVTKVEKERVQIKTHTGKVFVPRAAFAKHKPEVGKSVKVRVAVADLKRVN